MACQAEQQNPDSASAGQALINFADCNSLTKGNTSVSASKSFAQEGRDQLRETTVSPIFIAPVSASKAAAQAASGQLQEAAMTPICTAPVSASRAAAPEGSHQLPEATTTPTFTAPVPTSRAAAEAASSQPQEATPATDGMHHNTPFAADLQALDVIKSGVGAIMARTHAAIAYHERSPALQVAAFPPAMLQMISSLNDLQALSDGTLPQAMDIVDSTTQQQHRQGNDAVSGRADNDSAEALPLRPYRNGGPASTEIAPGPIIHVAPEVPKPVPRHKPQPCPRRVSSELIRKVKGWAEVVACSSKAVSDACVRRDRALIEKQVVQHSSECLSSELDSCKSHARAWQAATGEMKRILTRRDLSDSGGSMNAMTANAKRSGALPNRKQKY